MPYAVLGAMTFPSIFYATSSVITAAAGCITALVLAWFEKGLLTVAACASFAVLCAELLKANGIEEIQDFVEAYDDNSINIEGVTKEALDKINELINENVEFVEEDAEETEAPAAEAQSEESTEEPAAEEEEYFCPECGAKITLDMTQCPNCGVEFEFTEDEE